jgi:hypothetical protein
LLEKIHDESPAAAALTLSVAQQLDEHFGELEQAFFAAGDAEPDPAEAARASGAAPVDLFDDLSLVAPEMTGPSWRQRLIPLYRLGRLWLSIRLRLLVTVLRGAVPSALPLLVRTTELPPRYLIRRPLLAATAKVVLAGMLVSVWAGVVLAATRLGG